MGYIVNFFATPLIDYNKLMEQQSMVQVPDVFVRSKNKYITI